MISDSQLCMRVLSWPMYLCPALLIQGSRLNKGDDCLVLSHVISRALVGHCLSLSQGGVFEQCVCHCVCLCVCVCEEVGWMGMG